jgi:lipopolysaccharide export system protein LptA
MRSLLLPFLFCVSLALTLAQATTSEQADTEPTSQESSQEEPTVPDSSPSETPTTDATTEATEEIDESLLPTIEIRRKDRSIRVVNYAPDEEGGQSRLNIRDCQENDEELRTSTFYAPAPSFIRTYVNDAVLTSPIAFSLRPPNVRNEAGEVIEDGGEKAKLELVGGTLEISEDTLCPEKIERTETADVTLKEGRTTVLGANFLYENNTGIGNMKGPITLDRVAEGDSPALNATSDTLEINVDDDKTFLEGNVKVNSEDRVSEATTLEYNEEDGIAILQGDRENNIPAKSTKGSDVLQGYTIIYYLDTNDVVVQGDVQGDIEVDLGEGTSDGSSETDTTNSSSELPTGNTDE